MSFRLHYVLIALFLPYGFGYMTPLYAQDTAQKEVVETLTFEIKIVGIDNTHTPATQKTQIQPLADSAFLAYVDRYLQEHVQKNGMDRIRVQYPGTQEYVWYTRSPIEFALLQNYPNPFNPETTISYTLAASVSVQLQLYTVTGQVIRTLVHQSQTAGTYTVVWDGKDTNGMPVASGIYFYQITAGKFQDVRKLFLLK